MPRSATTVDHVEFKDTGCPDGMLPSCLACPLPRCRFDDYKTHPRRSVIRERQQEIRARSDAGAAVDEIVEAMGVSRRTVFRALQGRAR